MMHITLRIFFSVLLTCAPYTTQAVSDDFTVQTLVGGDVSAPTVPANLVAEAVASDQIDLDWDASSDNVAVAGYQVFRDTVQIATTTLTTYADTGLSSSTLYAYYIRAFDAAFNVSTSSATVATTTLAPSSVTVPFGSQEQSSGSFFGPVVVSNLTYVPGMGYIDISYDTSVYVRSVLRWGRTNNYELGFIATEAYRKIHTTRIDDLSPGTVYEIEIVLTDRSGRNEVTERLVLTTESAPDTTAPPNVSDLIAEINVDGVTLTWNNPEVEDFAYVRVVSSDLFYPLHYTDGWLVYEGEAEYVFDARALSLEQGRYYTVFTYDRSGNMSSGAVTYIARQADGTITSVPVTDVATTSRGELLLTDVRFIQNNKELFFDGTRIVIDSGAPTLVAIPYERLPEHLKTIVVSLNDPKNSERTFSFLLRINADKTVYEAAFAPLRTEGLYPLRVSVFDYQTKQVLAVHGELDAKQFTKLDPIAGRATWFVSSQLTLSLGVVSSIVVLYILWLVFGRRRRSQEAV